MIKGQAARIGVLLLDASGAPVASVTPTVQIKVDNDVWKSATNSASQSDASGRSDVLLDAGETTAEDLQIHWAPPADEFIPILQTIPGLLDVNAFKADTSGLIAADTPYEMTNTDTPADMVPMQFNTPGP